VKPNYIYNTLVIVGTGTTDTDTALFVSGATQSTSFYSGTTELTQVFSSIFRSFGNNQTISSNQTVDNNKRYLVDATSGNITLTLPDAATIGDFEIDVKKIDSSSNSVIIDASGSDVVDGATGATINSQYETVTIVGNGSAYYIF